MKPALRTTLLVTLAIYLGAWVHEGLHSVQNAAAGEGLSVPYFQPFTALGCPAFGPHGFPALGCTDDATCERATCEVAPYIVQFLVTPFYAFILLTMKRPAVKAS